MHAGDALWRLYGSIAMLEQLYPTDARVSFLAGKMRECVSVIGAHITVPEPSTDDLGKLLETIRGELPAGEAPAEKSAKQTGQRKFTDPEIVEAAQAFIGAMVESQLFDWANMVEDIHQRLHVGEAFFTFKQARAILNIAARGEFEDGPRFMDRMEDDYPEATKAIEEWAAQA